VNVSPIKPIAPIETAQPAAKTEATGDAFANILSETRQVEADATHQMERFAKGDPTQGIHEVMIASEKANIQLRYATTLKNKALEAYKELMNTQV
jgi:flagellar hook-basal body complex protein FliE